MRSFLASFFSLRSSFLLFTLSSGCGVLPWSLPCARISTMINLVRAAYNNCMQFSRILSLAASMGCCLIAAPVSMSPEPPLYQMIRGQYEDKIRRYSPPEKIFNVFSVKNESEQYVLTLQGLLQAICFYNYSEYTGENLESFDPQNIKQLLGKEKDFEIYDYFTFARFLAFDRRNLEAFMHQKGLSEIDKSSFKDLMLNQVCADYDTYIRQNIGIESRQFRPRQEDFLKAIMRTADSMFQKRQSYTLTELIDFRQSLMKELYTYEFKCYKTDQNAIDGVDFARSIIKYAQNNQKRKFLRRVKTIQQGIQSIKVKEKQYVDFHFELQLNLNLIEQTLQAEGAIRRQQIGALLRGKGELISEGPVEVFFRLLDTDDSGFIEKREVLGVIESLGYYWNVKSGEQNLQQLLETRWNHLCNKARKIHQILLEE